MAKKNSSIGQRVDDALTNYLRNTTTDQEIKDFYGEGNIVGRKGIPTDDGGLLDAVTESQKNKSSRPKSNRKNFNVGGISQEIGYDYSTRDIPGALDPGTGRPWQMTFGQLPKDFGDSSLTPAAKRFLSDFRVPKNTGSDYSFDTGPNIEDRINYDIKQAQADYDFESKGSYPDAARARFNTAVEKARAQSPTIGSFSGVPQTPQTWMERGVATGKPEGFGTKTLDEFKSRIIEDQGRFGGVSTLTPVEDSASGATNRDWRADLYERRGLAGPQSSEAYNTGYGVSEKTVQRFTPGNQSLLPLQPYTEFIKNVSGDTPSSVVGTTPAPDFTPLQNTLGTRNYLLGRNILQGRGSLGRGLRSAGSVGAVDFIPSREAIRDFAKGDLSGGTQRMAGDFARGIPVAAGAGVLGAFLPAAVSTSILPAAAISGGIIGGSNALDEATKQQTGEGLLTKMQHTVNKFAGPGFGKPTTGSAYRGSEDLNTKRARLREEVTKGADTDFKTPTIRQMTPREVAASTASQERLKNENEFQRRVRLARERFNPKRGEFGFTEFFAGR